VIHLGHNIPDELMSKNMTNFYDILDLSLNYPVDEENIYEPLYSWIHLSCANTIPEIFFTPKTPFKFSEIKPEKFGKACAICKKDKGICVKCPVKECDHWVHGECARRAQYFFKEKFDQSNAKTPRKNLREIYCHTHRPFRLLKDIAERKTIVVQEAKALATVVDKVLKK